MTSPVSKNALLSLSLAITVGAFLTTSLWAQEAPVPRSAPRVPVHRQETIIHKSADAVPHQVSGTMAILETERLRIDDLEIRLFGIVPPQLSASFGPQARAALDNMVSGKTISCQIRDRGHDGRLLATCTSNGHDLALDLLQRGLAITARGSLSDSDLAIPYIAAEQAAQSQKSGLWSVMTPSPAPITEAVKTEPKVEPKIEPKAEAIAPPPAAAVKVEAKEPAKPVIITAPTPVKVATVPTVVNSEAAEPHEGGFVMRYQILIAGLLILTTALAVVGTLVGFRLRERREETRAIAAALRGELMAARAVCTTRIKTITTDAEDKAASWPRIRSTLYQAYVGRMGALGAELSRQVASIYGQTSDYAVYYNNNDDTRAASAPKKKALETLIRHIEEVLPKLALIEKTGTMYRTPASINKNEAATSATSTPAASDDMMPQNIAQEVLPPHDPMMEDAAASMASAAAPSVQEKLSPVPLWNAMRNFTREHMTLVRDKMEDHLPDYSAIIEEEMEEMSFTEEDEDLIDTSNVTKLPNSRAS